MTQPQAYAEDGSVLHTDKASASTQPCGNQSRAFRVSVSLTFVGSLLSDAQSSQIFSRWHPSLIRGRAIGEEGTIPLTEVRSVPETEFGCRWRK
jgi:hypothetical protein